MARVAVLLGQGFEDSEFQVPFEHLQGGGHEVDVIGVEGATELIGKRGDSKVRTDLAAAGAYAYDYDALVIPGGYSPDHLRTDQDVVSLVRAFLDAGKPVAAICHGPQLLIEADAVNGKSLTSWPSVRTDLVNAGAEWRDEPVVVDGNLITSRKPDDLQAFCEQLDRALVRSNGNSKGAGPTGGADAPPRDLGDIALDAEGFLLHVEDWNEDVAVRLAAQVGLTELSRARWLVIHALRDWYLEHHTVPDFKRVCEAAQQSDAFCMERLFENDGSKAWRIAGLPNPGEELKAYL
jgi:protease I